MAIDCALQMPQMCKCVAEVGPDGRIGGIESSAFAIGCYSIYVLSRRREHNAAGVIQFRIAGIAQNGFMQQTFSLTQAPLLLKGNGPVNRCWRRSHVLLCCESAHSASRANAFPIIAYNAGLLCVGPTVVTPSPSRASPLTCCP